VRGEGAWDERRRDRFRQKHKTHLVRLPSRSVARRARDDVYKRTEYVFVWYAAVTEVRVVGETLRRSADRTERV